MNPKLSIVLIEPEIPQNTGNIGRTCVALGLQLHLVGQLGFSLEEKQIKRSGLDYWDQLDYIHHPDWKAFLTTVSNSSHFYFLSTKAKKSFWETQLKEPAYLFFGNESRGLPVDFYKEYEKDLYRIPMINGIRSLNLSSSVAAATYEAARQFNMLNGNQ